MTKNTSARYSPEVRAPAARTVLEHQGDYASQWAAINSISSYDVCPAEGLISASLNFVKSSNTQPFLRVP